MPHKARIVVWYDAAQKVCRISPPWAIGAGGDHIAWFNRTGQPIHVHVNAGVCEPVGEPIEIDIRDGGHQHVQIAQNVPSGSLSYRIFCSRTMSPAVGNSDPEIIVE
jgi:hypothetical protein